MNSAASPAQPALTLAFTLRLLLPFACGYFLSYCYRSVNAIIAPDLVADLNLDAADLGLLTSVYFLAFALFQLPLGILLDRFGPRRVETTLLLVAASGALLFAYSETSGGLLLGRALIGMGVSACLMASFKTTASWFPRARVPAMNAWIMTAGGLGALSATRPVELALEFTDWRGVVSILGFATIAVAALLFFVVPERGDQSRHGFRQLIGGVAQVYRNAYFWRVVPLTVLSQSAYLAIQGLWAGPWLHDVAGLDRIAVADSLLWLAVAMVSGFLLTGNIASALERKGFSLRNITAFYLIIFMLTQLGLVLGLTEYALPLWLLFGFFGSSGVLAFPLLQRHFSGQLTGRVNTCANVLVFLFAFATQWAIGLVVNLWPDAATGGYAITGYSTAFGLSLALQTLAFIWFMLGSAPQPTHEH